MASKEYQLQVYVIRYLDGKIKKGKNVIQTIVPFPQIKRCWHVYQGRSADEGFYLKEMGVRTGVHDLHLIYEGVNDSGFGTLELKIENNQLTDNQKDFGSRMVTCGHKYAVCRSVKDVRDTLINWGLACKNMVCIEPPPSLEEQRKIMHGFYGRPNTKVKTLKELSDEIKNS